MDEALNSAESANIKLEEGNEEFDDEKWNASVQTRIASLHSQLASLQTQYTKLCATIPCLKFQADRSEAEIASLVVKLKEDQDHPTNEADDPKGRTLDEYLSHLQDDVNRLPFFEPRRVSHETQIATLKEKLKKDQDHATLAKTAADKSQKNLDEYMADLENQLSIKNQQK